MLTYCFESSHVARTLAKCRKNDLAVVDTEGHEKAVREAVSRGVWVYGYLNIGALEKERPYYEKLKHLRIAPYAGWNGEYWVDVTDVGWQEHLVQEAKEIKALGCIGLYLDNTDIFYMCKEGFDDSSGVMRKIPKAQAVYNALASVILRIHRLGLVVMPNGGDDFVKKFIRAHPGVIASINQEGLFYEDFKRQPKSETEYRKAWMKWAAKHISGKVRGIEYCKNPAEIAYCKAYYKAHGWDLYISKHKELRGD